MKEKFKVCNKLANNNLNNRGNLSEFLKSYLSLAQAMGKEQIAFEGISELPPSETFNKPDSRIDVIISMCEDNLIKSNTIETGMGMLR